MRAALVFVLCLSGCGPFPFGGPGAEGDPPPPPPPTHVDLVMVVDNSNSMERVQEELEVNLPSALLSQLGSLDAARVGVTTTDLQDSGNGNQGNLRDPGPIGGEACTPSWTDTDDADFAGDLVDLLHVGTDGDGLERPLYAGALAICKAQDETFWAGLQELADEDPVKVICSTVPAKDRGCNAGFRREGAALAVLIVTDEGDSSASSEFLPPPDDLDACAVANANDPLFGECDCRIAWWHDFFDSFDVQVSAVGPTYQAEGQQSATCDGGSRDYPGPCNGFNSSACSIDHLQLVPCLTGGIFEPVETMQGEYCESADFQSVAASIVGALNSL